MQNKQGDFRKMGRRRIGDVLKEYGYINDSQLEEALAYQKNKEIRLGEAFIELGYITEKQMLTALAHCLDLKSADAFQLSVDIDAVRRIPEELAVRHKMLAIREDGDILTVLTNDPLNFYGVEDIRQTTGMNVELVLCERQMLDHAIRYYYAEVQAREAARMANNSLQTAGEKEAAVEDRDGDAPVINLLNSLIYRAFHNDASDIHIEPFENCTVVRMRIDGALVKFVELQKNLQAPLIARIKILGDMDIAEHRVPQDGHFRLKIEEKMVNMRISVMPTVFGEKAVIRLLSGKLNVDRAETYGMCESDYEKLGRMLMAQHGLVYVTGPTGSGKTTTMYMILSDLAGRQVNISTIEDPVEWNLPHINQTQVNSMAGLTFETGLRALLRQDPDIIMVGETRDAETAAISVRAAITGHLVFSTLHTNDAVSAIIRLEDMGVQPYLAANALTGIVAQRLIRKVCPDCAQEITANERVCSFLGKNIRKIRVAKGCPGCHYTGYRGRVAIHEVLYIDQKLRQMITDRADEEAVRRYVRNVQGMLTLKDRGIQLVEEGVTTMEELFKAICYE